jgi:uncharacterized protein with PhoU and TrkA domain
MRLFLAPLAPLAALLALAACTQAEPENVQARAQNASIRLEERFNQIQAEAENDTADAAAPVENEAEALLNQLDTAAADKSAANAATNAH